MNCEQEIDDVLAMLKRADEQSTKFLEAYSRRCWVAWQFGQATGKPVDHEQCAREAIEEVSKSVDISTHS